MRGDSGSEGIRREGLGGLTVALLCVLAFPAMASVDPTPYLPSDTLTPGVIRPELTLQAICATKWGKDKRMVTEAMKMEVFRAYGYPLGQKDQRCPCEIDHRIPRSVGGADDVRNLSVQSYRGPWNAHDKDRVEDITAESICMPAGGMSLDAARAVFTGKWTDKYIQLFGVPPDAR